MCYPTETEIDCSGSNRMDVRYIWGPKNLLDAATCPLGWGRGFPKKTPSNSRSNGPSVDPPEKNWPLASRLPRALKVIGIEMYWSAACDFLLVIHCDYRPLRDRDVLACGHFRVNDDFGRKSDFPPIPMYLTPPLSWSRLELCNSTAWC